jgi:hypothetical protein
VSSSDLDERNNSETILEAFGNAAHQLGVHVSDLGALIGADLTTRGGIDPNSAAGELALLFIRCYQNLYVLMGGDSAQMMHWMHTENRHTRGVPAEQVKSAEGLAAVVEYLDAIRGAK